MSKKYRRSRLWVDPAFQFRLLLRQVVYCLLIGVVWVHIGYILEVAAAVSNGVKSEFGGRYYLDFLSRHRFLLTGMVIILPAILYDLLKFSHHIAGPLYRCRTMMQDMAAGKPVAEFTPRKHDLMRELIRAFNDLIKVWNAKVGLGVNGQLDNGNGSKQVSEGTSPPRPSHAAEPA